MQQTPSKSKSNFSAVNERTPEKVCDCTKSHNKNDFASVNDVEKSCEFKTLEKISKDNLSINKSSENKVGEYKTPDKKVENFDLIEEQILLCDGENEMISTTEQARLLIAASKTPSKSLNKTPAKQSTPSGKRSIESSPVTPGKFRRVELVTLASPKAKRIRQL